MALLPAALVTLGLGMKFKGTLDQGKAQQAAYNYNASVARTQASQAREAGTLDAYKKRKASESFTAKQRALFSKANVQYVGSPLEVLFSDATDMEMDALIIESNAQVQASAFMSQAEYDVFLGKQARSSSRTQAWGSLLTSAGSFALMSGIGGPAMASSVSSSPLTMPRAGGTLAGTVPMSGYL